MQIRVTSGRLSEQQSDALVVALFEGEDRLSNVGARVDEALGGAMRQIIQQGDITGKQDELTLIHTLGKIGAPRVLVVGLGKRNLFSLDTVRITSAEAARRLRGLRLRSIAFEPFGVETGLQTEAVGQAIAEGVVLGLYTFARHKSSAESVRSLDSISIVATDDSTAESLRQGVERGRILAGAANFARDMANEPSNYMTPTELASQAREAADAAGLECQVLDREDMVELGMGALLGVAKGSHEEPKFIVLSYKGDPGTDRAIGFVGKGITFDTGGISIKPADHMEEMKGDMSGGATVIAALKAIAELGPHINVTGIIPATENMPGGGATKPGDVLVAMNGKTIEVINTDAEGRLILADGLSYARKLDLSPLIDVATLTGAISIALGDVAVGVMSNNQELVDQLIEAGKQSGEKLWQLPMYREYREQIDSDVADIKNTAGNRKAGSIIAAWFLSEFVDQTPWAHLDMAGVDLYDRERGWIVKGASGIPVRTLINFAMDRAKASSEERQPEAAIGGD
ncbi:MAG: leucyl aminopeptidase [Dehalococcoidia bacterium]